MGKKNSKLKQETVDQLISETYCKYLQHFFIFHNPAFFMQLQKRRSSNGEYLKQLNNCAIISLFE